MHEQFPNHYRPATAAPFYHQSYPPGAVARPNPYELYQMMQRLQERVLAVEERISRLEKIILPVEVNASCGAEEGKPGN